MTVTLKRLALPRGPMLEYAESGLGTAILFLHGYTDSWRSFEPVLVHLPKSLRAIALSQRGHGNSERPGNGYRCRHFADDVLAFLNEMEIQRAVIVGHCMGSQVALSFAAKYPERVSGLVVIGAFGTMRNNAVLQDLWDLTVMRLKDPIDRSFVREFQASTFAGTVSDGLLDAMIAESLKVPARVWRAACAGLLQDDVRAQIASIDLPTLILWGDADTLCGRHEQEALSAAIKHSRLTVYRGAGHALHWERPEQAAEDIAQFADVIAGQHAPIRASRAHDRSEQPRKPLAGSPHSRPAPSCDTGVPPRG